MPIPTTDFNFSVNNLEVTFTDASSDAPSYWAWLFGDGTQSNIQNPVHTFALSGSYAVSLISGNNDGNSLATKMVTVVFADTVDFLKIYDYITYKIPAPILEAIETNFPNQIPDFIKKWQIYLANLVTPPLAGNDMFIEAAWQPLARTLIGELVFLDILNTDGSGSGGFGAGARSDKDIKKIVTGPSEVEWYQSSIYGAGGAMEHTKSLVCMIASQLGVHLPFCGIRSPRPMLYIKTDVIKSSSLSTYLRKHYS